jgi:hypothetical protein
MTSRDPVGSSPAEPLEHASVRRLPLKQGSFVRSVSAPVEPFARGLSRQVFRPSALSRYQSSRDSEESAPPIVVRPRVLRLWLVAGTLVALGLVAWSISTPIYVTGRAVTLDHADAQDNIPGDTTAVVLVPPEYASRMRSGQPVLLDAGSRGMHMAGTLLVAPRDTFDRTATGSLQSQFRDSARGNFIPVGSVALASADAAETRRTGVRTIPARVRVGRVKAISYLPIIGRFFAIRPAAASHQSGLRSAPSDGTRARQAGSP